MQAHTQQDDDRLITSAELRRRANMGRTKEWELRRAGKLRPVLIGSRINYPVAELRRIVAEGTEAARG